MDRLRHTARAKAADWRAAGDLVDLDVTVHPPAQSARLAGYLLADFHHALSVPAAGGRLRRSRQRAAAVLMPELHARVNNLERYAQLLTNELTAVIARLDVEAAELRARVSHLESELGGRPAGPEV